MTLKTNLTVKRTPKTQVYSNPHIDYRTTLVSARQVAAAAKPANSVRH
jgi:hypothetical protein